MIQLDLNTEEKSTLVELLKSCITDLRSEIIDTDNRSYREMLKERREIMIKLLNALEQTHNHPLAV